MSVAASAKTDEARGWNHGLRKWVICSSLILKTMGTKPNRRGDYVVITVRLPTKLLKQLGRWLLMAGSTYVLLHQ